MIRNGPVDSSTMDDLEVIALRFIQYLVPCNVQFGPVILREPLLVNVVHDTLLRSLAADSGLKVPLYYRRC
jgi:hypothetical protein